MMRAVYIALAGTSLQKRVLLGLCDSNKKQLGHISGLHHGVRRLYISAYSNELARLVIAGAPGTKQPLKMGFGEQKNVYDEMFRCCDPPFVPFRYQAPPEMVLGRIAVQRTSMAWIQHLTNEATRDSSQLYRQRERGISHV